MGPIPLEGKLQFGNCELNLSSTSNFLFFISYLHADSFLYYDFATQYTTYVPSYLDGIADADRNAE